MADGRSPKLDEFREWALTNDKAPPEQIARTFGVNLTTARRWYRDAYGENPPKANAQNDGDEEQLSKLTPASQMPAEIRAHAREAAVALYELAAIAATRMRDAWKKDPEKQLTEADQKVMGGLRQMQQAAVGFVAAHPGLLQLTETTESREAETVTVDDKERVAEFLRAKERDL